MADEKVSPVDALSDASRAWGEIGPRSASPKWGMAVDQERCIGCWSCAVICKSENDIPLGLWWNRILTEGEALDQPEEVRGGALEMHWLPLACQHCENAPCVKVCPVQATYHRDDGLVMQDYDRCIGCRYCMIACPYGVRNFNWGAAVRPTPHETGMVGARPLGTVEKCTMCVQRIADDQVPSCVWSCPTGARVFGDLNDPDGRLVTLIREREGYELLEEAGTLPAVKYLPPRRRIPL
jgi:dimethyl sulfoxide reductase iron-sulfur subunit